MADHTLTIDTVAIIESLASHEKKTGKTLHDHIRSEGREATYLPVETDVQYRAKFFMHDDYPENMAEFCPTYENLVAGRSRAQPARPI